MKDVESGAKIAAMPDVDDEDVDVSLFHGFALIFDIFFDDCQM